MLINVFYNSLIVTSRLKSKTCTCMLTTITRKLHSIRHLLDSRNQRSSVNVEHKQKLTAPILLNAFTMLDRLLVMIT